MNANPADSVHKAKSFCRMCIAVCGVVLTINQGRITGIRRDREHPISKGCACFKGLQAVDAHHGAARQSHTLQRRADGTLQRVGLRAQHGCIVGIVKPDNTLRRGVVSMSHNWGLADNGSASYDAHGASTNLLISADRAFEAINPMPHMSAIPVSIEAYEGRT